MKVKLFYPLSFLIFSVLLAVLEKVIPYNENKVTFFVVLAILLSVLLTFIEKLEVKVNLFVALFLVLVGGCIFYYFV